jgi:hypothetical protein
MATVAACGVGLPVDAARGATVAGAYFDTGDGVDWPVSFTAGGGERNDLTVTFSGSTVVFEDRGARLRARDDCHALTPHRVRCHNRDDVYPTSVSVRLGNRDDSVAVQGARFDGLELAGGAGRDRLRGGRGVDILDGGAGADRLLGMAGSDLLDGGPGADLIDGGAGAHDLVDYSARSQPVSVALGARRGSVGGEHDRLARIEDAAGGSGDDRLVGSAAANQLIGGPGDDRLSGLAGPDELDGDSRLSGSYKPGQRVEDLARARQGADVLDAGAGNDVLNAGDGGGYRAAEGSTPDELRCGAGADRVDDAALPPFAVLFPDCERFFIDLYRSALQPLGPSADGTLRYQLACSEIGEAQLGSPPTCDVDVTVSRRVGTRLEPLAQARATIPNDESRPNYARRHPVAVVLPASAMSELRSRGHLDVLTQVRAATIAPAWGAMWTTRLLAPD